MIFGNRRFGDSSLISRLMVGTAFSALALGTAQAQTAAPTETVVVTGTSIRGASPTGSNLITVDRAAIETTGASNVVQLLSNVPGITNFGNASATGGNSDFAGGFAPAIHNIGGGSSSATLVLINGHRFPTQGLTEAQADPSIIPTSALERVDVLPDGASSIYGSDAVAGVLNFVTRRNFTGAEVNIDYGVADHYSTSTISGIFGKTWSGGSVLVAADISSQSNLFFGQRDFNTTRQDIRRGATTNPGDYGFTSVPTVGPTSGGLAAATVTPPAGPGTSVAGGLAIPTLSDGVNFQTFNCPVATISPSGSTQAYYYQPGGGYGGQAYYTTTANVPSQGFCDGNTGNNAAIAGVTTLLPSQTRNSGMISVRQEITDNLSFDLEAVFASRLTFDHSTRGIVSNVTVYGPGAATSAPGSAANNAFLAGEVNPFFQGNSATGTVSETVRGYDFNALLGPGAYTKSGATNTFATAGLTWDLGNDREIVLSGTIGDNFNTQHVSGTVSPAEAFLALDGTINGGGNATSSIGTQDAFGLGTLYPVSRILNTSNALDVWNPAGPTNRTSQQVINSLKSNQTITNANQGLQDLIGKFDGPVFDLPAGSVKVAVGGEYMHATMDEYGTNVNAAGPTATNSNAYYYREGRSVYSAFLEFSVPVVSADMGIPLVHSFQVDLSGRYDKYSDVGDTENPKIAFDWIVTDGLKLRGSHGTSFVAPTVHDAQQFNSQSNIGGAGNFANTVIPFGDTRPFSSDSGVGAGLAGTWVSTPAGCAGGNGTVVQANGSTYTGAPGQVAFGCKTNFGAQNVPGQTSAGFTIPGGNNNLHPATGRSDEFGIDLDFGRLVGFDGLTVNITYWDINYRGLITNQQTQNNVPQLSTFAPIGGWTPTSPAIQKFIAGRPLTLAMPTTIWYLFDQRLQNAYNIWENGIDFAANYTLRTDDLGTFHLGASGTELLRYTTQAAVTGAPLLETLHGRNAPRYPSAELQARFSLGWAYDAFNSTLSVNYQHPASGTFSTYPYNLAPPVGSDRYFSQGAEGQEKAGSGGTVHVPGFVQFNLAANYALPSGFLGMPGLVSDGMSVSLNIDNIFDNNPSWSPTSANGYVNGSPVGRLVTLGVKKKF